MPAGGHSECMKVGQNAAMYYYLIMICIMKSDWMASSIS